MSHAADYDPDADTGDWPCLPAYPPAGNTPGPAEDGEPGPEFPAGLWLVLLLAASALACGLAWLLCEYQRVKP